MVNKIKLPELLAPAGNFEKMRFAYRYGADAVYLASKKFGMRAAADNFTMQELEDAVAYARSLNKKVYVTVNIMPHCEDVPDIEPFLNRIEEIRPDAVIVADLGVFSLCTKILKNVEIHISTQAATVNYLSCRAWHEMGAKRVVLSRELNINEIAEIRAKTPKSLELEAFVHGAMCVSFSGRCLLSNFFTGRDANKGACTQPCRWEYKFSEVKRESEELTAVVEREGTYIFGSKDMCLIEHIDDLCKCGLDSLKIEGRMKSAYYTATVTNAYRKAMTAYAADPEGYKLPNGILEELDSVSHREYCTGYYYNNPLFESNLAKNTGYIKEKAFFATVTEYDGKTGLAKCKQRNKLSLGDTVCVLSPMQKSKSFIVKEMYDLDKNPISSAPHAQMEFYVKADFPLNEMDILYGA